VTALVPLAENPLVPPIPELVVGLLAFAIVFGFLAKKLLPNINKVLEERREAIEGGMEKAETAQSEAQEALEQYRAQLAEARHEAARLRQEAQEQGAALIAEMRAEGQRQREEIVAAGHAQIEADRKAAAAATGRGGTMNTGVTSRRSYGGHEARGTVLAERVGECDR